MFRNLEVGVFHHVLDGIRIADLDRLQKLMDQVVPQELLVVDQVVRDEVGIVDGGVDKRSLVAVRAKHDRDLLRTQYISSQEVSSSSRMLNISKILIEEKNRKKEKIHE